MKRLQATMRLREDFRNSRRLYCPRLDAAQTPVATSGPLVEDVYPQAGRLWLRAFVPLSPAPGIADCWARRLIQFGRG